MATPKDQIPAIQFALKFDTAVTLCNALSRDLVHAQYMQSHGSEVFLEEYENHKKFHEALIKYIDQYC